MTLTPDPDPGDTRAGVVAALRNLGRPRGEEWELLANLVRNSESAALEVEPDTLLLNRLALEALVQQRSSSPGVTVLTDLTELRRRLIRLSELTRRELVSVHAGAAPSREVLESSLEADRAMITRGVELRIVFPADFCRVAHVREYSAAMEAEGALIRFADALPHRLIVSDHSQATVPIDYRDLSRGAVHVTNPLLARSLRHLSVSLFRRGRTLAEVDPDEGPTEIELRLLQALNSGATDEAAARALAISERTLRRYLSALLTKLGATSRFQAGVKAVERGWL